MIEHSIFKMENIILGLNKKTKSFLLRTGLIIIFFLTFISSSSFMVYQNQTAQAAESTEPDLIIESISWSPENPLTGETVTINVIVKNQGTGKAIGSQLSFYVDELYKGYQYVESLEFGASVTVEFDWTASQGNHILQMVIDADKAVSESDETNNEKSATISSLVPDLIIQTVTFSPSDPLTGANVTFSVTVLNQGDGNAIKPLVSFNVDGKRSESKSLGTLSSGDTDNTTFIWRALSGTHTFEVIVNPGNTIIETNINNNTKTITDFPAIIPDLTIGNITWTPAEPSVGDTVTFSVNITNTGRVFANPFNYSYYIGSKSSGIEGSPSVAANSTIIDTFTWPAEPGPIPVRVVLDTTNKITEADETNNELTVTYSGTKVADLVIQSLTWSPANPSVGEIMTVSVTIKNEGTGNAGATQVTYFVDDIKLISADTDPIAINGTRNMTYNWTVQEGYHTIKAIVNPDSTIPESDEGNNEHAVIYPIPPDLIIKEIVLSPEEPVEGDNVTFTVTVKNQGASTNKECTIGYNINDIYLGFSEAEVLASNATDSSSYVWVATSGRHTLVATVDSVNTIVESDESNNKIIRLFSVPELSHPTTQPDTPTSTTPGTEGEQPSKPVTSVPGGITIPDSSPGNGNNMLLYYMLGLAGIVVVTVIFVEVWRRQS